MTGCSAGSADFSNLAKDVNVADNPTIGSTVCIKYPEEPSSSHFKSCIVGKILDYFAINGTWYCSVETYLRPNLLPEGVYRQGHALNQYIDVISDSRECVASLKVNDILCECKIIPGNPATSPEITIQEYANSYPSDNPVFVCRFALQELTAEGDKFAIEPFCLLQDQKMTQERCDVLLEKNVVVKVAKMDDLKSFKESFIEQRKASMQECLSDTKEECKENLDYQIASLQKTFQSPPASETVSKSSSRPSIASRTSVRRSLETALDGPPVKQTRYGSGDDSDSKRVSSRRSRRFESKENDGKEDTDSSHQASWVSELLDENKPVVESDGRCLTPIRLSIKRVPTTKQTPSKENLKEIQRGSDATDSSVTGSTIRRSTRRSRCTMYREENIDSDSSENVSQERTPSTSKRGRHAKDRNWTPSRGCAASSDSDIFEPKTTRTRRTPAKTPQRCEEEDLSPEKSKTPLAKRSTRGRRSEQKDDELMSPGESDTPLTKRTPHRSGKAALNKTPKKVNETRSNTPCKSPRTPRTKTPSKASSKGCLTPSMPARSAAPLTPSSSLEQVRKNLHVSAVPMSLPCREGEYRNIYSFLENKIRDAAGGCMYISGVPGTGKTATVHAVIRALKKEVEKENMKDFQYIEVNGLRMTEPRQVFVQVLKALTGQKCTPQQAQDILAKRFCSGSGKNKTVVLLVDEVDMLRNRRQDVIYNLFDWPSKSNSHFIVLTIANTMDLPERLLKGRVTSRLGLTRLTFQPYSYKQLQEIVMSRLQGSNSFNDDAVELVARKVAACSGDVRRALDICRRASEVVEEGQAVTMPIVNKVLSQMMNSANVCSIKACSQLEKLFLQAVVAENERTGVEETSFISVYRQLRSLCALDCVAVVNISEAMGVLSRLGTSGLLLVEHSRADINQSIFLNVNADDIHYAINQTAPSSLTG